METSESRSQPVEDYLKEIFALGERDGRPVTTSRLSERLGLSSSSVSGMLRRLATQDLIDHRPYGEIRLTNSGRAAALEVVRRHRLIEMFLVAHLGYGWDEVHDEAETLEHAVSEQLVERIDIALGRPRYDPHGDPIPGPDGALPEIDAQRLPAHPLGHVGHLVRYRIGSAHRTGRAVAVRRPVRRPDRRRSPALPRAGTRRRALDRLAPSRITVVITARPTPIDSSIRVIVEDNRERMPSVRCPAANRNHVDSEARSPAIS
jgi:Mn-dependent DtxR family transcriptional regulator